MVLSLGPPGWMCQPKSPLDHQPKPTMDGSASHCDETWLQSKSAGTSDFLRVFFFVVDDQILPEGFTFFFFQNLGSITFLDITPMLQELKWCFWEMFLFAPYMTQQIKNVTNSSEIDFSNLLFVFSFFSETFPLLNPYPPGEVKQQKTKHRRTLAVLLNFLSLLYLYTPQHFEHRYQTWRSFLKRESPFKKPSFWVSSR